MLKTMRTRVREGREAVGPVGEEARTKRKVAVGCLAIVFRTAEVTVSRNDGVSVLVVVVLLWGGERGMFEVVGWRSGAGERLGVRRMLGMLLAVTRMVIGGRNRRLRSGCMACR